MDEKFKDILSGLSKEIDQETLMLYLQGQLQPDQLREVEKQLAEDGFESDAVEGLQGIKDKQRISHLVESLNRDLKHKIETRKKRRDKLRLPNQGWLWISVLILLLLVVLSFFVIHRLRGGQ